MADQKTATAKLGRFALWELLVLIGIVAAAAACYSKWLDGDDDAYRWFVFAAVVASVFVFYVVTRSKLFLFGIAPSVLTVFFLYAAISFGHPHDAHLQCQNHLKQIGLALQIYHDTYGEFPPAYIEVLSI